VVHGELVTGAGAAPEPLLDVGAQLESHSSLVQFCTYFRGTEGSSQNTLSLLYNPWPSGRSE
jgi:hypothetical protein